MLWLDGIRNEGDAVDYKVQPSQCWASVTSRLTVEKLCFGELAVAIEESENVPLEQGRNSEKVKQVGDKYEDEIKLTDYISQPVDQVDTSPTIRYELFCSDVADTDERQDSNDDDRPVCKNVESIDDLRSELTEVVHIENNKDANEGDRETSQNIVGIDHLSQDVTIPPRALSSHSLEHHQDLSVYLSVSKTDSKKKSTTNLHLEMNILADSLNVHMKVDGVEQDASLAPADQHLALDLSYSRSVGDVAHQHQADEIEASQRGMLQSSNELDQSLVELSEEGMLLEPKQKEQIGLDCIKLKLPVQEDKSSSGQEGKLVLWSGLVNSGFQAETGDDEAQQMSISHPGKLWLAEDFPSEAYNYDSDLPEIKIDDGNSDVGDTNEDIRDFQSTENAAEEIDSLINSEAKGDDVAGDEVDTNEDIRPVFENMAAFDHLSSEANEKSLSKSSSHLDSSVHLSDINLHLNVCKESVKIGLALTSLPDTVEEHATFLMKTAVSDVKYHGVQNALDLVVLEGDLNSPVKHLYADELYTGIDSDDSSSTSIGGNQMTVQKAKSDVSSELKRVISDDESSESSLLNESSRHLDNHSDMLVTQYEVVSAKVHQNYEQENLDLSVQLNPSHRKYKKAGSVKLDERISVNSGARNNKTVTRSTHLDISGLTLQADIIVQKTLADSSWSELGELSPSQDGNHDSIMVSTSGAHCIVTNESEESVTLTGNHHSDLSDVAFCAFTCADTVFWVCLLITIILFEMCKCYWVFVIPGCVFLFSLLVSENSKPND
ncbi:hypothetical protein Bpfe_010057 [Biomphalaria pfeifferi]|uniref:Uncharacterized protein n=1 Tax=Biomphalaria pfeifferi TaxID=112525 RepID=A0AAD8FET1_BIOPF|nr:hypothetical protein Bpfe_010057 [Biomphalaria pfeifferi]